MHRLDPSRIGVAGLLLLTLALAGGAVWLAVDNSRTYFVRIAAGDSRGESFVIATALKTVAERHHPRLRITVQETGGTTENLQLLERGQVDMATAQADVPSGPSARQVADLYADVFQLVVHQGLGIDSVAALRAKRVALPKRGGQYRSFLAVAAHFGLQESEFHFVGDDDASADRAFATGQADAAFRVRALGNPVVTTLVRELRAEIVPIGHAAAMRIKIPAFEPAVIPEGAYSGNPAIPAQDLPSVGVQRTLVAARRVADQPVNWITSVLMERRHELAEAIPATHAEVRPLLASVRPPGGQNGLGAAVHPGAESFYNRDKPSFVAANADVLALVFSIIVLAGSGLWELKRYVERHQKNHADRHSNHAVLILNRAKVTTSVDELDRMRADLLALLTQAVYDLDVDKISEASFHSFRAIWQISLDVIRERRAELLEPQPSPQRVQGHPKGIEGHGPPHSVLRASP